MTNINALIAEMRAGMQGVTPGPWAYEPHGDTGQYGVGVIVPPDIDAAQLSGYQDDPENIVSESVAVDVDGPLNAAHIARCSPCNISALLDEIERLRADNTRLQTAVNSIASQKKYAEHGEDELRGASFEDAFDTCVDVARKAALFHLRTAMEASNGK
jgi:hypothetical protein